MAEGKPIPGHHAVSIVVWGGWALLTLGLLGFVWEHGRNVPFMDDLFYVPFLTFQAPVTPEWLVGQINEHRVPLQRLILVGLLKVSRKLTDTLDFRALLYFNALLPILLALALIRAALLLRGRLSFTDLFLPLVLLNWGHGQLVLWGSMMVLAVPTVLAGVLFLLLQLGHRWPRGGTALLVLLVLLLAGSGAVGVAYLPVAAVWLGYLGTRPEHSGKTRRVLLLGMALFVLVLVVGFFGSMEKTVLTHETPTLGSLLSNMVQFLTLPLTSPPLTLWPLSGLVVLAAYLGSVVLLFRAFLKGDSAERLAALGFLVFLGGAFCLAVGLAQGRAQLYGGLLSSAAAIRQYVFVAVPGLCAVYLAWVRFGPARTGPLVQWGFLLAALLALPMQMWDGRAVGRDKRDQLGAAEQDMRAAQPFHVVLARHGQALCPRLADHALLAEYLRCLRDWGGGAFAHLRDDPSFTESPLSPEPTRVGAITWDGKTARGTGGESFLEFDLPHPQYLAGMRIRYRLTASQPTYFQMFWRRDEHTDYPDAVPYDRWPFPHGEGTMLIYIADTVQQFRIHPDLAPFEFRIEEITLLTTAPPAKAAVGGPMP